MPYLNDHDVFNLMFEIAGTDEEGEKDGVGVSQLSKDHIIITIV